MSIEALQEWNHVATIAGTETSSLERAFIKVNSILGDIALDDVKSFAGVFHALGISIEEFSDKRIFVTYLSHVSRWIKHQTDQIEIDIKNNDPRLDELSMYGIEN